MPSTPSTQRERKIFDWLLDIDKTPVAFTKVKINSSVAINYGSGGSVINREFTAVTDENGYWEITVIPTLDFLTATRIELKFGKTSGTATTPTETVDDTITSFTLSYGDGLPIQLKNAVALGSEINSAITPTMESVIDDRIAAALDEGVFV